MRGTAAMTVRPLSCEGKRLSPCVTHACSHTSNYGIHLYLVACEDPMPAHNVHYDWITQTETELAMCDRDSLTKHGSVRDLLSCRLIYSYIALPV